jgi:hypothetical protein
MSGHALRWLLIPVLWLGSTAAAAVGTVPATLPPASSVPASLAPTAPPPAIPAAVAAPVAEGRHQFGLQIGGSGFFQLAYRLRVVGPAHLELGAAGLPHSPFHVTASLLAAIPVSDRWRPYLGFGVGHAGILGRSYPSGCMRDAPGCLPTDTFDYVNYFSARAGVGYAFGAGRRHSLGIDVGGWYGERGESRTDPDDRTTKSSRRVIWPMAGLSWFYRI